MLLYNTVGKIKVGSAGTGYVRAPEITIDPPSEPWGINHDVSFNKEW
ncbi:hypothetical protein CM15mP5_1060 [bacterium]|nr:MAG: hypothetical protein CM15mP5_1060 [bacterium]